VQNRRFLSIELSTGIARWNFAAYLYAVLISSAFAGALAMLQPGLLHVMGVPFEEQGRVTGYLTAMQELVFLFLMPVAGAISDRVGRKAVYVFGLLTTSIGFGLYPYAGNVTELIGYRLIVAVGSAAIDSATCTTANAVHVAPSCIPAPPLKARRPRCI